MIGEVMPTRRCGASGLELPALSFGLWQGFGADAEAAQCELLVTRALELGITHLDLANNYGPPTGAAEARVGALLRGPLAGLRDRIVITTKAGYRAWPGSFGEGGSRKHLLSSLDASLARLGLAYVDIFYSHRYDPTTPLRETIGALASAVASGRALYAGISSYSVQRTREAVAIASELGLPLVAHQASYSLLNPWIEQPSTTPDGASLLEVAHQSGLGVVAFSPLAQGMLSDRYLDGVPRDSRAARGGSLRPEFLSDENVAHVRALADIANSRRQSLAQLAVSWVLRDPRITTALVGASRVEQLEQTAAAVRHTSFTEDELAAIAEHVVDAGVNIWAARSSQL